MLRRLTMILILSFLLFTSSCYKESYQEVVLLNKFGTYTINISTNKDLISDGTNYIYNFNNPTVPILSILEDGRIKSVLKYNYEVDKGVDSAKVIKAYKNITRSTINPKSIKTKQTVFSDRTIYERKVGSIKKVVKEELGNFFGDNVSLRLYTDKHTGDKEVEVYIDGQLFKTFTYYIESANSILKRIQ